LISKNPQVTKVTTDLAAVKLDLQSVRNDLAAAKQAAQGASEKADQSVATQTKIFAVLERNSASSDAMRLSIATLTEDVIDMQKQLVRLESKADSGR